MPTSRSPRPRIEPERSRLLRPLLVLAVAAVLLVALVAVPASAVQRFLPPGVQAEDFSGNFWHGSAGHLRLNSREAGALEWHLHPASLLWLTLAADLHWVKGGFVADARVDADRQRIRLTNVQGGGPIDDLADLGIASGWHGGSHFQFSDLTVAVANAANGGSEVRSAVGDLGVTDLSSAQFADDANLGGYDLRLADGAITPNGEATATLSDSGGPLEVHATIHYSANEHRGLLSGTLMERPEASAALRTQLQNLTQLHPRDAEGRIPVELEFTL